MKSVAETFCTFIGALCALFFGLLKREIMKIILLFGGACSERFVSFSSSKAILTALEANGHDVLPFDPAAQGGQPDLRSLSLDEYKTIPFRNEHDPKHLDDVFAALQWIRSQAPDLVFLGLHGGYGEDGFIQECLERIGVAYTGSSAVSSKMVMDKHISKQIISHCNVATARWVVLNDGNFSVAEIEQTVGMPCVVKPNVGGSSVALTIVQEASQLKAAIELAFTEDESVMVEQYIAGRELTVTVLGNDVFPIIEIRPKGGLYDYEHKYTAGMTDYLVPAPISAELTTEIQAQSKRCFETLGMSVYGRVDYRLGEDGVAYFLEANTLPGMTSTSLVPKSLAAAGTPFPKLIETIVSLSRKKDAHAVNAL